MNNPTQLKRYKKLISFIEENFKEEINIAKIEEVCFYSYRSINRIFEAIHRETIGKYIKRLRLEKAAQYLKYSAMGVSEIGYEVGFEDRAAFSKAFKNRYGHSPSDFRTSNLAFRDNVRDTLLAYRTDEKGHLEFEIERLPGFDFLFLEYRGDCDDIPAMEKKWTELVEYLKQKDLLTDRSIFMTEIVDDVEISDHINSRYNQGLVLEKPLDFEPEGFFQLKTLTAQKYAKFVYQGPYENCIDFYHRIYALWMEDVALELVDRPHLEFYPNFDENLPTGELLTEIYIAVE